MIIYLVVRSFNRSTVRAVLNCKLRSDKVNKTVFILLVLARLDWLISFSLVSIIYIALLVALKAIDIGLLLVTLKACC